METDNRTLLEQVEAFGQEDPERARRIALFWAEGFGKEEYEVLSEVFGADRMHAVVRADGYGGSMFTPNDNCKEMAERLSKFDYLCHIGKGKYTLGYKTEQLFT